MGAIMTQITITNADDRALFIHGHIQQADVRTYALEALVDTGAVMLALPEDVVQHLGLRELSRKTFILADGSTLVCPVAGPLYIEVVGRELVAECVVLPPAQDALIGQVVLESLDLIADCAKQVVYPRHGSSPYPVLNLK